MNQFHRNQVSAGTKVGMKFVVACNAFHAQRYLEAEYPNIAWSVIPKAILDKGLFPKQ